MNATSHATRKLQDRVDLRQSRLQVEAPYFPPANRQGRAGQYFNHLEAKKIHADGEIKTTRWLGTQFIEREAVKRALSSQIRANVTGRLSGKDQWTNLNMGHSLPVNQKWHRCAQRKIIKLDA